MLKRERDENPPQTAPEALQQQKMEVEAENPDPDYKEQPATPRDLSNPPRAPQKGPRPNVRRRLF